jgi:ATP-dependent Clp protease ATP-binding subunit ClpB
VSRKVNADPKTLLSQISAQLGRLSKISPPPDNIGPSAGFNDVLRRAKDLAKAKGDSFVSIDHFLLSLGDDKNVSAILTAAGITREALHEAVASVRGKVAVNSKNADSNFEALSKYAIDLVEEARAGKLMPTIGREEEIRRISKSQTQKKKKKNKK